ncbi:MAG: hypothetical protein JW748_06155 [Anaerolineales bacterium]|nr:hypothetical protein [Anaerolineales bacterium]
MAAGSPQKAQIVFEMNPAACTPHLFPMFVPFAVEYLFGFESCEEGCHAERLPRAIGREAQGDFFRGFELSSSFFPYQGKEGGARGGRWDGSRRTCRLIRKGTEKVPQGFPLSQVGVKYPLPGLVDWCEEPE